MLSHGGFYRLKVVIKSTMKNPWPSLTSFRKLHWRPRLYPRRHKESVHLSIDHIWKIGCFKSSEIFPMCCCHPNAESELLYLIVVVINFSLPWMACLRCCSGMSAILRTWHILEKRLTLFFSQIYFRSILSTMYLAIMCFLNPPWFRAVCLADLELKGEN